MARRVIPPALIAHGGAGPRGLASERSARRQGMLAAVERGAGVLRNGGSALDAVIATVKALEDDPLFNAGFGSLLTDDGSVEMDASVMVAEPRPPTSRAGRVRSPHEAPPRAIAAGAVAVVTRIRNPIVLARAVMERTPHLMMAGAGAERFARRIGMRLCRNEDLITPRARERWLARRDLVSRAAGGPAARGHGTVGAVAIDAHGLIAAATSTGGVPGKLAGRVGDSAIIGAGTWAASAAGASATGHGEAIIATSLCREAVATLGRRSPHDAASRLIASALSPLGAQGGIIIVDRRGRIGFAHNAESMQVGAYQSGAGLRHHHADPVSILGSR
jgi:L-asparaginase / beta-aspartyl-peptidase